MALTQVNRRPDRSQAVSHPGWGMRNGERGGVKDRVVVGSIASWPKRVEPVR